MATARSSPVVSRHWLRDRDACPREHDLFGRVFGEGEVAITREVMERALKAGLNTGWVGIRLLDEGGRGKFINFTIDQRGAALEQLLGVPPDEWRRRAVEERAAWTASGDYEARSRALVCQDMVEDVETEPTVRAADAASLHALRAIGMAGLDEAVARRQQAEHLLALVTGEWK